MNKRVCPCWWTILRCLSRIAGLFSRRGYNIDSLTVGETADPRYSRMTVVVNGDDKILDQITKQLAKLVDVVDIKPLADNESVSRELVLVKVRADGQNRQANYRYYRYFSCKDH